MTAFQRQLEAIGSALILIQKLPDHAIWALEVSNDDDTDSPTVLNIFAPTHEWSSLVERLKLGRHTDEGTKDVMFKSYKQGTLHISIIEED